VEIREVIEEEEKMPVYSAPPISKILCAKCEASFDDSELGEKLVYLDECFHLFCK
jgi:hypothetical protein